MANHRKDYSYDCRECGERVPEKTGKSKGIHRMEHWCPQCGMHHNEKLEPRPLRRARNRPVDPFPEPGVRRMVADPNGTIEGIVKSKIIEHGGLGSRGKNLTSPARTVQVLTGLARGGTQKEVAEATGVTVQGVHSIRKSKIDLLEEIHAEIQTRLTEIGIREGVAVAESMATIAKDTAHRNAPNAAKVFFEATAGVGKRSGNLNIGTQHVSHNITVEGDAQIANISDAALDARMKRIQDQLGL